MAAADQLSHTQMFPPYQKILYETLQWNRDQCRMHLCTLHTVVDKAGHKLCYHFTLSGLSCMNMQSHSITGVLSPRIHQSSSQWWAINGKLVSDHVRSFLEVV